MNKMYFHSHEHTNFKMIKKINPTSRYQKYTKTVWIRKVDPIEVLTQKFSSMSLTYKRKIEENSIEHFETFHKIREGLRPGYKKIKDFSMTAENIDPETLITLVQQRSTIYDYKDKLHSNRDVQERLWKEISRILKAPVSECKTKWTTLCNSFSKQLREEKKLTSGSEATKKRKWHLYDNMTFLKDYMFQHKDMTSNLIADDLDEPTDTNVKESGISNFEEQPDMTLKFDQNVNVDKEIDSEQSSSLHEFKKPKNKKKVLSSEMIAELTNSYLKSKTTPKVIPTEDSPELLFLKSLIQDFKKLNNKNQRIFKSAILSTLDKLLDAQVTSSSATSMYTSNFLPLYSNHHVPIQQHTIQPQPLNQTTQFLFSKSPELLSSSESSDSY